MRKAAWVLVAAWALAGTAVERVEAQVGFGVQASLGSDSDLGLGGRLVFPPLIAPLGLDGVVDANYFFGGGSAIDSWIDANVNVRIPVPLSSAFRTRFGGGLNATFVSFASGTPSTDTESEIGLNLLGSIERGGGRFTPFLELRAVVGGAEQVVLTGGLLLGGSR